MRRLATCVLLLAIALDHLGMLLQHESEQGRLLLQVLHKRTCPFHQAQRVYGKMMLEAACHSEELLVLFHFYAGCSDAARELSALVTELVLCMSSMLWFMGEVPFTILPFPWAAAVDVLTEDKAAYLNENIFDLPPCEHDVGMTSKILAKHKDAESALGDQALMDGLGLWSREVQIENMKLERLLAEFRKVAGGGRNCAKPSVEKIVSAGLLTQMLQLHRAAGGDEPAATTRNDLLDANVPIQAATAVMRREVPMPQKTPAWLRYAAEKRQQGEKLTRSARSAEQSRLAAEYRALPQEHKERYEKQAQLVQLEETCLPSRSESYERHIGESLPGIWFPLPSDWDPGSLVRARLWLQGFAVRGYGASPIAAFLPLAQGAKRCGNI